MIGAKLLMLVALCAGVATAQEFPFKNGPLDPSLHSNKIFFNITDINDIAGVWKGITDIRTPAATLGRLFGGQLPIDQICSMANSAGLDYGFLAQRPLSSIILGSDSDASMGKVIDMHVEHFHVAAGQAPTETFEVTGFQDGIMRMADGSCRIWKPYFDWEVGKTMFVRNRRVYMWFEGDDFKWNDQEFCVDSPVDHPYCSTSSFIIDGQEKQGVVLDGVMFFECTAGPCLELPHALPGFVKTQGWQPRN